MGAVVPRVLLAVLFQAVSLLCIAQISLVDDDSDDVAFKVKSIDDFMDRFNAKPGTELDKYIRTHRPNVRPTREQWIWSLFNRPSDQLRTDTLVRSFVLQVTDSVSPCTLSFSDKHWYAKVECSVLEQKKVSRLTLILKIKRSKSGGYSWSVVSAQAPFLSTTGPTPVIPDSLRSDSAQKYFLSPVSHGIDFVNLKRFFDSGSSVRNFLLDSLPVRNTPETEKLVSLIAKRQIRFQKVNHISYYLLQIKGWIVGVDYFERPGRSSGWLINVLNPVSPAEKEEFIHQSLFIPRRK